MALALLALLFEIPFDKDIAHEIGGKGCVIFLALTVLAGFFRFVLEKKVPSVPKKDSPIIVKMMIVSLSLTVCLGILWAFTRDTVNAEEIPTAADRAETIDKPDYGYFNSSNSNVSIAPRAVNSNIQSSNTSDSHNVTNTNNIVNSTVNSPTNIYTPHYNSTTLIQRGDGAAASQATSQGTRSPSGGQAGAPERTYSRDTRTTAPSAPTKQNDPELVGLVQQLHDLRKRGLRESHPDTVYDRVEDCYAAFISWKRACLAIMRRIDSILEERYHEESLLYSVFERDARIPTEVLQVPDGISSCRRFYLTLAQGLSHYIPKLS